jgi:hypothetical protein
MLLALVALPLLAAAQGDPDQIVDGGAVEVGESVEGTLTEAEPAFAYTIDATADQALTFTLTSEDFDCYLVLMDEDGNVLDTDDDSAGSLDSRIGPFVVPADGTYTVVAQSFSFYNGSSASVGDFVFSVDEAQVRQIEYTQTIEDSLTNAELTHNYTFTAQAGDAVVVRLESDDFDSYLRLLSPNGSELTYNDDGGGNLNSLIGPYPLSETGTYTIVASSLGGQSTGDYVLSLNRVEMQQIAYGDKLDIEFTPQDQEFFFTFEGTTGDVLNVEVDSDGGVDTSLTLNDPFNYQVLTDEDGGSGFDPEISGFVLTQTGQYTLLLRSTTGLAGTVAVNFDRGELPSLDEGAQSVSFSGTVTTRALSFTGEAGAVLRFTAVILSGDTGSPSIELLQAGSSVAYISANGVSRISFDLVVPDDGDVLVNFSDYSYSNVSYEVTLESVE